MGWRLKDEEVPKTPKEPNTQKQRGKAKREREREKEVVGM